jgi:cytochrome c-type biogenesis protein CcmH/NrfG
VLAGSILGAALVIAILLFARIAQTAVGKERYFLGVAATGLLIAGAVVAIVLKPAVGGLQGTSATVDSGALLTELGRINAGLRSTASSRSSMPAASGVASVPSLLTGLERRLESNPYDAPGWALLAQSYAFVGQMDLAEEALAHAVELGFDEADLRSRVESAQRSPHAGLSGVALAQALAQ